MKDGTIAEKGAHEELVSNDKYYNQLMALGQLQKAVKDEDTNSETVRNGKCLDRRSFKNVDKDISSNHGIKQNIEEEKINQMNVDEGDVLNYSSWSVLLEYFKVSHDSFVFVILKIVLFSTLLYANFISIIKHRFF